MNRTVYITTSIPYVNAKPHIGHALELVQADALARFFRGDGNPTIFQTGTDENAQTNVQAAEKIGVPVQELVDKNSDWFCALVGKLEVTFDTFIRTSQPAHQKGVAAFWNRIRPDDLYKKRYSGLYCVGCEDFYLESDLVDGACPDHGTVPTYVEEENIFFRLSRYQDAVQSLIKSNTILILPDERRREVLSFVQRGLTDISVSRLTERMGGWGIPVPGNPDQTIYVWIDALMNYVTGQGFEDGGWRDVWNDSVEKCHVIGKNVWKFHAVYWPALLLSAGLPVPDRIYVHGFVTAEGNKISKSLGNVIDPHDTIDKFGVDAVRIYLLSLSPFVDGDYSEAKQIEIHNTLLSNGIGNLVTRISTLCARGGVGGITGNNTETEYNHALEEFRFDRALGMIRRSIDALNQDIQRDKAWECITSARGVQQICSYAERLAGIMLKLRPFIPGTAMKVLQALKSERIDRIPPLYPKM